jgi:hypothetical protein
MIRQFGSQFVGHLVESHQDAAGHLTDVLD